MTTAQPMTQDLLPSIAPIRTQAPPPVTAKQEEEEESSTEECSTPTSEDQKLKPALACPPTPRKPRPAKRKLPATTPALAVDFCVVTRDLSVVFRSLPPKKRIRVAA
jgi:endonuclease/exonuclease/phosphatase family metal-dependent hydrolase